MGSKILLITAVMGAVAGPLTASAQTTLDYQGYVMGGTSTISTDGNRGSPLVPLQSPPVSAPISTVATFDATFTYSGSVAQNNLVIDSYQVDMTAFNGQVFDLQNIGPSFGTPLTLNGTSACFTGGGFGSCFSLTVSGETVTGATINLYNHPTQGDTIFDLNIGPRGDTYSESVFGAGYYGCTVNPPLQGTYTGPNSASPCAMNVSNPTSGVWTTAPATAPEIDSASAASGLTLLMGFIAVMCGRRAKWRSQYLTA